jgi:preprotein translocase subunit YajC
MNDMWILAQAPGSETSEGIGSVPVDSEATETKTVASDPNKAAGRTRTYGFNPMQLFLLILMFVVFYFILFRGPRRKQQQHRQMVQSLQRNDKVRTIGGIIGVVVDIKGDEITLKVDESNNTKIKVASSAIGRNLSKDNK